MAETTPTIAPVENSEVTGLKEELKQANEKLGTQGKELKDAQDINEKATLLATVISADEEIRKSIETKFDQMYGNAPVVEPGEKPGVKSEEEPEAPTAPSVEKKAFDGLVEEVSELKGNTRDGIVMKFEEDAGISELPIEERKEMRKKIAAEYTKFGREFKDIPTHLLKDSLATAYKAVDVDKAIKEGNLESLAAAYSNTSGALPNMGTRGIEAPAPDTLTPGQKVWAENLGQDPTEVEKVYKERENESLRVPEKEKTD